MDGSPVRATCRCAATSWNSTRPTAPPVPVPVRLARPTLPISSSPSFPILPSSSHFHQSPTSWCPLVFKRGEINIAVLRCFLSFGPSLAASFFLLRIVASPCSLPRHVPACHRERARRLGSPDTKTSFVIQSLTSTTTTFATFAYKIITSERLFKVLSAKARSLRHLRS